MYAQVAIDIYMVDIATGAVTRVGMDLDEGHFINTMNYDRGAGIVYGTGVRPNANKTHLLRTVVGYNVDKNDWDVVGTVDGYLQQSGQLAAINSDTHSLCVECCASCQRT